MRLKRRLKRSIGALFLSLSTPLSRHIYTHTHAHVRIHTDIHVQTHLIYYNRVYYSVSISAHRISSRGGLTVLRGFEYTSYYGLTWYRLRE